MTLSQRTEQALYEIHVLRDTIINGEWVGFHKFAKVVTEAMQDAYDIGVDEAQGIHISPDEYADADRQRR